MKTLSLLLLLVTVAPTMAAPNHKPHARHTIRISAEGDIIGRKPNDSTPYTPAESAALHAWAQKTFHARPIAAPEYEQVWSLQEYCRLRVHNLRKARLDQINGVH